VHRRDETNVSQACCQFRMSACHAASASRRGVRRSISGQELAQEGASVGPRGDVPNNLSCDPMRSFAGTTAALMKPVPFHYVRPTTLKEACRILAQDEDARLIAGGQTLIPLLAMRLARPTILVDIVRLSELAGIARQGDGVIIGAATRQADAQRAKLIAHAIPLLARALPWVGHPAIRKLGTIGGSIANADPSAEIPLVAVTLEAEVLIGDGNGATSLPADGFFMGPMLTAIGPAACVTGIRWPVWPYAHIGVGFHEISTRRRDFALVAAAAQVGLDDVGRCLDLAVGIGGAGDRPVRLDVSSLRSLPLDATAVSTAIKKAVADLEVSDDRHASAGYRRRVAAVLATRALTDAWHEAARSIRGAAAFDANAARREARP
jgi:CO/xanthine dehydrogenase FAD-binding subunit